MQKLFSKESIAVLIAGTRRSIKQYAWEKLRPWHVTPQQCGVLMALFSEGGMSLGEVASRIWCDNPTACRIVNKLVERGLVRSDSDAQDRRRFRLHLTADGQALCNELTLRTEEVSRTLEQGLSEKDLQELRSILRQVMSNAVSATQRPDKTIAAATASVTPGGSATGADDPCTEAPASDAMTSGPSEQATHVGTDSQAADTSALGSASIQVSQAETPSPTTPASRQTSGKQIV